MPRRLISDMDLPQFARRCLHGFWTSRPCRRIATYQSEDIRAKGRHEVLITSEWRACEEHKLPGDVPMKRPTVLTSTVGHPTRSGETSSPESTTG